MSRRYILVAAAETELRNSALYDDQKSAGLGEEFLDEFEDGMKMILSFPEGWGKMDEDFRRYLLRRFPYGII